MKIFEITKPKNVVEPEEPIEPEQQPAVEPEAEPQQPVQQAPAQQAPVQQEPARKPRYKWQTGPSIKDFGHPGWEDDNAEARAAWYGSEKSKEYSAAHQAHHQAQLAAMHKHAGVSEKDFDTTIEEFPNPYYDPKGPQDEEDPNYEPEVISVGVDYDYEYHGKYYPATYYEPEEFPELEITINRVIDMDNGEDITKKVDLGEVEKFIEDNIPGWEEYDQGQRDQAAIDRYEANRDDYSESLDRIKNLSGLK
jgi:hypothetical protein